MNSTQDCLNSNSPHAKYISKSRNLNWKQYVNMVTSKAYSFYNKSKKMSYTRYSLTTFVCPILDHACIIYSPHYCISYTFTRLKWYNVELPDLWWISTYIQYVLYMAVFLKCLILLGGTLWKSDTMRSELWSCTALFIIP